MISTIRVPQAIILNAGKRDSRNTINRYLRDQGAVSVLEKHKVPSFDYYAYDEVYVCEMNPCFDEIED